jgi:hypothetical protein
VHAVVWSRHDGADDAIDRDGNLCDTRSGRGELQLSDDSRGNPSRNFSGQKLAPWSEVKITSAES